MTQPRQLVPLAKAVDHRPWATKHYLRRLTREHRIPYHKTGKGPTAPIFIDLADLDRFMEDHRIEAGAETPSGKR